jgi:hypothetical protein
MLSMLCLATTHGVRLSHLEVRSQRGPHQLPHERAWTLQACAGSVYIMERNDKVIGYSQPTHRHWQGRSIACVYWNEQRSGEVDRSLRPAAESATHQVWVGSVAPLKGLPELLKAQCVQPRGVHVVLGASQLRAPAAGSTQWLHVTANVPSQCLHRCM